MNPEETQQYMNNIQDVQANSKEEKQQQIINYIKNLIVNKNLNETDDTFNRDISIFTKFFNENDYTVTTIEKNNQVRTIFKLKESNNFTIEFEKLLYKGMFYNYAIKLYSSIIPNNTLDIIEEINVTKNLKDLDMCTKIIEQYINEVNYTASLEDFGEIKFDLNRNEYLRFYGKYTSSKQGYKYEPHIYIATKTNDGIREQEINKEQAIELYSTHFRFADRIYNFIENIYNFDLNKNIDMVLKSPATDSFNGQDILTLLAENGVENKELAEKAIADMLDKEGFLIETVSSLDVFLCREDNKENKLIPIVESVRQKILETEYPNGLKYLNNFLKNPKGKFVNGCLQYQNEIKSQSFAESKISSFLEKGLPIQEDLIRKITDNEMSVIENLEAPFNEIMKDVDKTDKYKKRYASNYSYVRQISAYQFVSAYKITNEISKVYLSMINQLNKLVNNEFFCEEMSKNDNDKLLKMKNDLNKFNELPDKTIDFILGKEILSNSYDFFKLFKKIRTAHTTNMYEEKNKYLEDKISECKNKIEDLKKSIGVFTFGKKKQAIETEINQIEKEIQFHENSIEELNNKLNELMYKPRYTQNEEILKYFKYDDYLTIYHPICCYLGKEEIEDFLKNTEKYLSRVFVEIPVLILKNTPFSEMDFRLDIVKNEDTDKYELKLFNKLTDEYENIEVNHNFFKIYSNFNKEVFRDLDVIGPALNTIYTTGKNSDNPYTKCVEGIGNDHYYEIEHCFNV